MCLIKRLYLSHYYAGLLEYASTHFIHRIRLGIAYFATASLANLDCTSQARASNERVLSQLYSSMIASYQCRAQLTYCSITRHLRHGLCQLREVHSLRHASTGTRRVLHRS